MAWKIMWTDQGVRDLERLDRAVAQRVLRKLEEAAADPPRFFERLVGADDWKLRVGDWRVLALLAFPEKAVLVEKVDHRSRVYER